MAGPTQVLRLLVGMRPGAPLWPLKGWGRSQPSARHPATFHFHQNSKSYAFILMPRSLPFPVSRYTISPSHPDCRFVEAVLPKNRFPLPVAPSFGWQGPAAAALVNCAAINFAPPPSDGRWQFATFTKPECCAMLVSFSVSHLTEIKNKNEKAISPRPVDLAVVFRGFQIPKGMVSMCAPCPLLSS